MGKKATVPDAWDDDWESQADRADAAAEAPKIEVEVKVSKAERLARHDESMRKVWESANEPEPEAPFFLAARDTVPLKTEFKPALKLLSRKPAPKVVQKIDPVTGLAKLTVEDDDDEDEEQKKDQPTPEELRARAQREREEKQKRYNEARERILGPSSGASSPGTVTPPEDGRSRAGKGRGRGNGRSDNSRPQSQSGTKELFDPNYTHRSGGVSLQKRASENSRPGRATPRDEDQIIRAPKGPDASGKGFGFATRGGKKV